MGVGVAVAAGWAVGTLFERASTYTARFLGLRKYSFIPITGENGYVGAAGKDGQGLIGAIRRHF